MKIIDISVPISNNMPIWPGDPPVEFEKLSSIDQGDSVNTTALKMSVHTGTHIDAPYHFIESGQRVDQISLDKLIGEVFVMVIDDGIDVITEKVLKTHPANHQLRETPKVLFRTRNSHFWKDQAHDFNRGYVGIDKSGAEFLKQRQLELIGIDYLSIAPYADTKNPHEILLSNGTILLEGLNLINVSEGIYNLLCLPLNISNCEGAPCRAALIDHSE